MKTKNRMITVVGGGSTAHAIIPLLSRAGHIVSLLTSRPGEWSHEVSVQHQSIYGDIHAVYSGRLEKVTDLASDVIPQADIIILCMPVSKYRVALHNVAPFIVRNKDVYVGTIYGQGGFTWMVDEIKIRFNIQNIITFAVGLAPWICRTKKYGSIGITYGSKEVNVAAVSPATHFSNLNDIFLKDLCERPFKKGAFRQADNFLSLTLSVDNQIIHPTRCYGLFLKYGGQWNNEEEIPFFYRDYDQLSADILRDVDNDYSRIRNMIKAQYARKDFQYMLDYLNLERLSYNSANTDIRESFRSSVTLGAIKPPTVKKENGGFIIDKDHRFFTDDIHYGLCIAKWIAEKLSIDVLAIDRIIEWAQDLRGEKLIQNGRLLMDSQDIAKEFISGIPSIYGHNNLDDIVD